MAWRFQTAKDKFSKLLNRVFAEDTQRPRRRHEAFVGIMVSRDARHTYLKPGFKDFLVGVSPDLKGLDLNRDPGQKSCSGKDHI